MKTNRHIRNLLIAALTALSFGACATDQASKANSGTGKTELQGEAQDEIRLDIVGTSDIHGWASPHEDKLPDGRIMKNGGLATFGGYMNILRKQLPDGVVLVDAGDGFQGTLLSNMMEGRSVVEVMNVLGYEAMAVGNHEFDYGPVGPKATANVEGEDALGALKAIAQTAKFPVLSYNLRGEDGKIPQGIDQKGFVIVQHRGVKIGILGLTTPGTKSTSNPENLKGLDFVELSKAAVEGVRAMREAGAEIVVGSFHEGNRCSSLKDPNDLSVCDVNRGLIPALQAMPSGLFDAVIGGDSHAMIGHFVNGMPVIQSLAQARAFGIIELTLDAKTRRPIQEKTRIRSSIPICGEFIQGTGNCNARRAKGEVMLEKATFEGEEVVPDQAVADLVGSYEAMVAQRKARSLNAVVSAPMHREYRSECPLGNALTDVLRRATGSDISVLNSGGLRVDLPAGPLTYGTIFEILPFDNNTARVKLTSGEVISMFERLLSSHHGVPQVSGLKLTAEVCSDGVKITQALDAAGNVMDRNNVEKLYTMTTSDFLASGGDGLGDFMKNLPQGRVDMGLSNEKCMRDEIADAIEKDGMPEPGIQGRITLVPCSDSSKAAEIQDKD